MTKREAVAEFRAEILPHLPPDRVAIRTAWNDYTDALCKARRITPRQYNTWEGPYR